ncbi:terminase gpA endonuclease subunit [Methylobacterium sp. WSM2598]|uniref:terminase gpA endonuclease subunit n=1 Tax=Methylobacterium sp. WSM2598 TaxID=398261 RepID=UPI0003A1AB8B|nr:terminase gpA endonuclease subunit [Methylobacterium sp. WSM2598]
MADSDQPAAAPTWWAHARKNLPALLERIALFVRPTPRLTPDAWGAQNRAYPASSGHPGPRNPYLTPYAVPIGRAIAERRARRVVGVMGAQSGKSETLLDVIGHRLDQDPAPILYVGPNRQFLTEQLEPRIMRLLDEAPTLANKVSRGKRMTKTRKVIGGVPLRLAHAGSSTALKADPASLAVTDEADEMLANVRGQGDPFGLIDARGDTYADFVHAIVSTPSRGPKEAEIDPVSGLEFWKVMPADDFESKVWRLFQAGTRYHWTWRCPECQERFIPRFSCLGYEGKGDERHTTPARARETAHIVCPRNGCILTEADKPDMNASGVYVAPGQAIAADGTVTGEPPASDTISFWVSGLCSPFRSFGDRAAAYVEAVQGGDSANIQTVVNAGFGECYNEAPLNAPKIESIKAKIVPYRLGDVPREVMRLTAGVDVQKRSIFYVVRGWGARGASWLLQAEELQGLTDGEDVWDDLADALTAPYGGLRIERAFIDSGFRPDKPDAGDVHRVYAFARRYDWLVVPTKGMPTRAQPMTIRKHEVDTKGKAARFSVDLATLDSDYFKSLVCSRILTPVGRPGSFHLPLDISERYCRHLISEVREIVAGKPVWTQVSRDNHWLDSEALAAAAGYLLNVQRIPDGVMRDWDETAPPPLPAVGDDVPPAAAPAALPAAVPLQAAKAAVAQKSLRDSLSSRMAARAAGFNRR